MPFRRQKGKKKKAGTIKEKKGYIRFHQNWTFLFTKNYDLRIDIQITG